MTTQQKTQIREALVRYTAGFDHPGLAAASLQGISKTVLLQVQAKNWDTISDQLWLQLARQVGFYCGAQMVADTSTFLLLGLLFSDAQHFGLSYGIAIAKGLGKTFAAHHYLRTHENVLYIACFEGHNRRTFIADLLVAAGVQPRGTVPEMMATLATAIAGLDEPLIIVDDAHLLRDRVLHVLTGVLDMVAGSVGLVAMGGQELKKKVLDGVQEQKAGYTVLYQRIGEKFVSLCQPAPNDAELICRANEINDEQVIADIKSQCIKDLQPLAGLIGRYRPLNMAA